MGKIVILEGPDGGGKTVLARKFEAQGWRYRHDGVPQQGRNNIAYYLEVINEAMVSPLNTVFDRLWLGERIYGPVARHMDTIGEEGQRLFMRLHTSKEIVQYIVLPQYDTAISNYEVKIKDKTDYLRSIPLFKEVYKRYLDWAYQWAAAYEMYDYTNLKGWPSPEERRPDLDLLPQGTVGSPCAKYLFIGDTPNHPNIDVPFHALNGSSGYFNQALSNCGIREQDLALTNAHMPNGKQHDVYEIVKSLPGLQHIFLMGNKANEWFMRKKTIPLEMNVRLHAIPHPSYMKRFKGHNPWVLAELIQKELNG